MKKRLWTSIGAVLATAALLTACGSATNTTAQSTASTAAASQAATSTVNVAKAYSGTYVGEIQDNGVVAYKGVRYATAERWQEPVVVGQSDEEIDATQVGPASDAGDPDCLSVSIYVNPESTNTQKSVFMWQYGSAQRGGTNARYDFSNFVKENPDIIVVCPNHRGGFFGSVDLSVLDGYDQYGDTYAKSNNLARLDLLACLKWINQNISAFGGNPDDVTIGGHSSGSNNVSCLLLMDEAQQYYQKAACQASFSCDISLETKETAEFVSSDLFDRLGVTTVDEALNTSIDDIMAAQKDIMANSANGATAYATVENKLFSPVIDDVVIPSDYYEHLLDGVTGKTFIFGTNAGEYDQQFKDWEENTGTNWQDALDFTISQNWGKLSDHGWNADNAQAVIDEYYSHNEEYGRNDWTAAKDLKNDLYLRCGAILYASALAQNNTVYCYYLDWDITPNDNMRASHGSENNVIARNWKDVPEGMRPTAAMISDMWASFVETGNPNNDEIGTTWEPYNTNTFDTLYITDHPYMTEDVRVDDVKTVLPLFREYPQLAAALGW